MIVHDLNMRQALAFDPSTREAEGGRWTLNLRPGLLPAQHKFPVTEEMLNASGLLPAIFSYALGPVGYSTP